MIRSRIRRSKTLSIRSSHQIGVVMLLTRSPRLHGMTGICALPSSRYAVSKVPAASDPTAPPDVMRYGGNSSSMVRAACISAVAKPSVNRS
jgi:hypothetical protein